MKSRFFLPVSILVLSFSALYVYASVWTGPTAPPPDGNTPPPINVGAITQTKAGDICTDFKGHKCLSDLPTPTPPVQMYKTAVGCGGNLSDVPTCTTIGGFYQPCYGTESANDCPPPYRYLDCDGISVGSWSPGGFSVCANTPI